MNRKASSFYGSILAASLLLSACVTSPPAATPAAPAVTATAGQAAPARSGNTEAATQPRTQREIPGAAASPAVSTDPTGFLGKTVKPTLSPKIKNSQFLYYGNDYYFCGGGFRLGESDLLIAVLRKGKGKLPCSTVQDEVVGLIQGARYDAEVFFHDVLVVKVPKGYFLNDLRCEGADLVLIKQQSTNVRYYKTYAKAWKVVANKFIPVADLKKVRCINPSYGSD